MSTSPLRPLLALLALTFVGCKTTTEGACLDANPCADGGDASAVCGESTTDPTVYTCDCSDGFVFDGVTCTADDPEPCGDGLVEVEDGDCVDEDGCTAVGDPLCDASGDTDATCVDVPAPGTGYTCDCSEGFEDDGGTCEPTVTPTCGAPDVDGQGGAAFPYGPDEDDDGDGLLSYMVAGFDVNDADAGVGLATGDGTFTVDDSYTPSSAEFPTDIALADVDGDGDLDVLVTLQNPLDNNPGESGSVEGWRNDGSGGLTFASAILDDGGGTLDVGDFSGDGRLDVISNGYMVPATCDDGFLAPVELDVAFAYGEVLDQNADGDMDVVVSDGGGTVAVLLGDGAGDLTGEPLTVSRAGRVIGARVNGDAYADVLVVVPSNGPETYELKTLLGADDGTLTEDAVQDGEYLAHIAAGDVNGDGHTDVVAGDFIDKEIVLLLGMGNGTFDAAQVIVNDLNTPEALMLVDLNGDSDLDLLFADQLLGVGVALGSTGVTFAEPVFSYDGTSMGFAVGDLNGDDVLDVVVAGGDANDIVVLLGD